MRATVVTAVLALSLLGAGERTAAQGTTEKRHAGGERHGWLGVAIQDVTPRIAREEDLSVKSGALVNSVSEESPAEKAGIREHDVIVEFNGKPVEESDDLRTAVRTATPGDPASITLYRGQEKKTVQVTLGKAPRRNFAFFFRSPDSFRMPRIPPIPRFQMLGMVEMLGLTLSDLGRQLGEYFGAPDGRGVLVQEVERKSQGEKAGFRAGDVIVSAGKESVENTEDIADALRDLKKGVKIEFGILRKGAKMSLTVESEGRDEEGWNGLRLYMDEDCGKAKARQNTLRREMEKLDEELRSIGTRIRIEVQNVGRKLRSIADQGA